MLFLFICSINSGMKLGWTTEQLVPEDDRLDLGVDISLLQASADSDAPAAAASRGDHTQKAGDTIDTAALAEELQDVWKG